MPTPPPPKPRLQKYLADFGFGARRSIEGWIEAGRIRVDGRVARLGDRVDGRSEIRIDGRLVRIPQRTRAHRLLLYHKPEGEICARRDPQNRPSVYRNLPKLSGARWVMVGRLDINTSGLLLFTNDGGLAHQLMHPSFGVEREYLCRIYGSASAKSLQRLRDGISLQGARVRFERVQAQRDSHSATTQQSRNRWYSVVVREGKYREVRRMWEAVDCRVSRLLRIRYGVVKLPTKLKAGQWQEANSKLRAKVWDSKAGNAEPTAAE